MRPSTATLPHVKPRSSSVRAPGPKPRALTVFFAATISAVLVRTGKPASNGREEETVVKLYVETKC